MVYCRDVICVCPAEQSNFLTLTQALHACPLVGYIHDNMPGERQTNNNGESRQQIFNGQAILYDVNAVDTMAPTNQSIDNYSTNFQVRFVSC